ncbi:hypothetical protein [Micromonospora sp. NPDC004704]
MRSIAILYLLPTGIFGLVTYAGLTGGSAFDGPWAIGGLGGAIGAAVTTMPLAPADSERGLVIGVNVGLAVALALFALFATDVSRKFRRQFTPA